jgi:hypothetical protein
MDPTEEEYFARDEEEDIPVEPLPSEEIGVEKPFELKRRQSLDDDGDDELAQLAQKAPKGIQVAVPRV